MADTRFHFTDREARDIVWEAYLRETIKGQLNPPGQKDTPEMAVLARVHRAMLQFEQRWMKPILG